MVESPEQWQRTFDAEMGAAPARMLDEQDAMLLGRVTYEMWAGYWPGYTGGGDAAFAKWINNVPEYVASATLDDDAALTAFELVEAQPTSSGAIVATYRPIRWPGRTGADQQGGALLYGSS